MPKGWVAQARNVRWLTAGIVAVVLGLAVIWVLFVPAADWLAHHDVGSITGSLHETALDNARGRLLTLGAGLFAVGALLFTARNFTLSREGQVTDRYTKAIGQLGSKKLDVRIGGIYALERVARDSARDHPTVMEVLTAFIREHSSEQWPPPDPGGREQERSTRPDVQAAVTVVGRRDAKHDIREIDVTDAQLRAAVRMGLPVIGLDLAGAKLTGANLAYAQLAAADLTRANLTGASLYHAKLSHADLTGADLPDAYLRGATLTSADLTGADLTGANLFAAKLTGAKLSHANLTRADLNLANLFAANLFAAKLTGAKLTGANLNRATLTGADLTGADLTGARWLADTPVPEGWKLDPDSGQLERVGTDSGPVQGK